MSVPESAGCFRTQNFAMYVEYASMAIDVFGKQHQADMFGNMFFYKRGCFHRSVSKVSHRELRFVVSQSG